ncbi:hypothetical protein ATCC90586_005659 [Pythium insidiosum]|nr:hypothetical protein ATCC90586_005659 [Pythium insidiosum]
MATSAERTPILPVAGEQPSTRRRRVAIIGGAVVLVTTLLVLGYSAGSHLWASTTSQPAEATTTVGRPASAPAPVPVQVAPLQKSAPMPKTLSKTPAPTQSPRESDNPSQDPTPVPFKRSVST